MEYIFNPFFGLVALLVILGFLGGAPLFYLWGRSDQRRKDREREAGKAGVRKSAQREKAQQEAFNNGFFS